MVFNEEGSFLGLDEKFELASNNYSMLVFSEFFLNNGLNLLIKEHLKKLSVIILQEFKVVLNPRELSKLKSFKSFEQFTDTQMDIIFENEVEVVYLKFPRHLK